MINSKIIENYKEYGKVLSLSNGEIEIYVTLDIGIRIVRFGFIGGQNILCDDRYVLPEKTDSEYEEFWGKGKAWYNMGGHRIWAGPEYYPECYSPDDSPVEYTLTGDGAVFTAKKENSGVIKQLELRLDSDDSNVEVINRVKNASDKEKEFTVWSITVCKNGGKVILPLNRTDTWPLSNRIISVWPYTNLSDKKINFLGNYALLDDSVKSETPVKLGFDLEAGCMFYVLGNDVFTKTYSPLHGEAVYPDGGCSCECYLCNEMAEIESLSPLLKVKPDEVKEHVEHWRLIKLKSEPSLLSEEETEEFLKQL